MLQYKQTIVKIDPKYTSLECNAYGNKDKTNLNIQVSQTILKRRLELFKIRTIPMNLKHTKPLTF